MSQVIIISRGIKTYERGDSKSWNVPLKLPALKEINQNVTHSEDSFISLSTPNVMQMTRNLLNLIYYTVPSSCQYFSMHHLN